VTAIGAMAIALRILVARRRSRPPTSCSQRAPARGRRWSQPSARSGRAAGRPSSGCRSRAGSPRRHASRVARRRARGRRGDHRPARTQAGRRLRRLPPADRRGRPRPCPLGRVVEVPADGAGPPRASGAAPTRRSGGRSRNPGRASRPASDRPPGPGGPRARGRVTVVGASHVVAISGWNIAIVAATLGALAGRVARRRRAALTAAAIVATSSSSGHRVRGPGRGDGRRGAARPRARAPEPGRGGDRVGGRAPAAGGPRLVDDIGFPPLRARHGRADRVGTPPRHAWLVPPRPVSGRGSPSRSASPCRPARDAADRRPRVRAAVDRVAGRQLAVVPLVAPAMAAGAVALVAGATTLAGVPALVAILEAAGLGPSSLRDRRLVRAGCLGPCRERRAQRAVGHGRGSVRRRRDPRGRSPAARAAAQASRSSRPVRQPRSASGSAA
jgi:hypothetical protein